ncbi:DUF1002 domain-containing protein [Lachnospiraceae bacterium KGMB03038]|nr:DUF1002 domain-containing protein [Lachnospiraceae bacterium KGMB03038]
MKKFRKVVPFILIMALTCVSIPMAAKADSAKVVTLGANLSEDQKNSMYEYFGTSADQVETIEVTNADEREYMEGIATESQIGTRTYSCSYVEPTDSGGIQVKVANLTFVTSSMIASTLLTSGMENCNVVAASPIEVSGTGALTGIMMAYETASGEELSEEQKEAAVEELVTTGDLADSVGQKEAADLMNDVKQDVIENGLTEEGEIQDSVQEAADSLSITLTDEQMAQIVSLMQTISQFDYDVNALKDTLDNLAGKDDGFFANLWNSITNFFTGGDSDGGIINDTNDEILGDNAVIDSTLDSVKDAAESAEGESWWDKVVNFFQGLFGGDDSEETSTEENSETSDTGDEATSPDSESSDDASAEENTLDDGSSDSGSSSEESSEDGGSASDSSQTEDSGTEENTDGTVNE